jgi:hypothetical protein
LRLGYDGQWQDWFTVHVEYDNLGHFGNWIDQPDFAVVRDRQGGDWLPLKHTVVDSPHAYWDTSIYRGWVAFHVATATLTLGRQRIAWGTARFWSPADTFNPISPLQVEVDEREGVDAARLEWTSPGQVRWDAVYAPQDGFQRSTTALRVGRTIRNTDVDVFGGRFQRDWLAGVDLAGQVDGAGVRGELTYRKRNPVPGIVPVATADALRFTVGADYAFPNTLYVIGEYFYNRGQPALAETGNLNSQFLILSSSEIFTRNRHFVSLGATYDLTPLWKVENYVIIDTTGPSVALLPSVTHNLTPDIDLSFGGQIFGSLPGGEFEGVGDLVYAEFIFHF